MKYDVVPFEVCKPYNYKITEETVPRLSYSNINSLFTENGFTKINEVRKYEEFIDSFKNRANYRIDFQHMCRRLCWCQTEFTLSDIGFDLQHLSW